MRVTLVTVHDPLAKVAGKLSIEGIVNAGLVTAQALRRDFGIAKPRVAVSGLNPHAGEEGGIGREEALRSRISMAYFFLGSNPGT